MSRLTACQVRRSGRILDAMWALDRGAAGVALVTDDAGSLVGVVTDGDIRRALLRGGALEGPLEPIITRAYRSVGPEATRAEVLDLMQALSIAQVPVVDAAGRLLGLHLLREVIGGADRPNWAVIMAGGRGTRLAPLTDHVPKPMIRVAGRPILERIVLHLVGFGIRKVHLSINYLGSMIEEHFGDGSRFGAQIEYLREDRAVGTGGALALLPVPPALPMLVLNGDLVTQADIGAMLAFHERGGQKMTLGLRRYFHTVPFGCLDLDGDVIVGMEEKPTISRPVNAGIYVLDPDLVSRVPKGEPYPITQLVETCLARGEAVRGFEIVDDWIDVGQREQLRIAQEGT